MPPIAPIPPPPARGTVAQQQNSFRTRKGEHLARIQREGKEWGAGRPRRGLMGPGLGAGTCAGARRRRGAPAPPSGSAGQARGPSNS